MIPLLLALSCLPRGWPETACEAFRESSAGVCKRCAPETDPGLCPACPALCERFRPDELARIGIKSSPLTFDVRSRLLFMGDDPLDPARGEHAMRAALPPKAGLEILEFSRGSVPAGEVEFPFSMLKSGLWRGYVRYGNSGRYDVWARVRVT